MKKVLLVGTFDRFNYGDLLFPIISSNKILQDYDVKSEIFALIRSDLSEYGALGTKPMRDLKRNGEISKDDIVIFAGGGIISASWIYMHSNFLSRTSNNLLYYLKKLIDENTLNQFSRMYYGGSSPFPFVASPSDFKVPVKIAYNAVGGSELKNSTSQLRVKILNRLSKASYLSVRDQKTKDLLQPIESNIEIKLSPDSAIIMSEQFNLAYLQKFSSVQHLDLLNGSKYVCFQANLKYTNKYLSQIVEVLEFINNKYNFEIVLLPIGRYVGLDDQHALRIIKSKLSIPAKLVSDKANIFEIMSTIASASLFIGTSLHGNVTSQSYGIPHLGLSDTECKLDYYLKTWDIYPQSICLRLNNMTNVTNMIDNVLKLDRSELLKVRADLISKCHANFSEMVKACGLELK